MSIREINDMKQRAYAIHNGPWLCASDIAALFAEVEKVAALQTENAELRVRCKGLYEDVSQLRKENESLVDKIVDTEH